MGDRACVVIREFGDSVVLYTHWGGGTLIVDVVDGLTRAKAEGRVTDGPYLARMLFCSLIRNDRDPLGGSTGYGIMSEVAGDAAQVVTIDVGLGEVTYRDYEDHELTWVSVDGFLEWARVSLAVSADMEGRGNE